jgi:thymidylate synthase (FAD)
MCQGVRGYNNIKKTAIYIFSKMSKKIMMPDGVGFVELLDKFGDDLTVVNAARVSFDKESHQLTEGDKKLINYLAKHDHITPFFHPQVRLRIKMPIFVCREYFRHTIGLSRNEVSRRYVDFTPECWVPAPEEIRERDPKAKQGSKATCVEKSGEAWKVMNDHTQSAIKAYEDLLGLGVAPEIARTVLPQSMYSTFIETGSLSAFARICNLRLDPSAQKEIRDYATGLDEIMKDLFPVSWEALSSKFKGVDHA